MPPTFAEVPTPLSGRGRYQQLSKTFRQFDGVAPVSAKPISLHKESAETRGTLFKPPLNHLIVKMVRLVFRPYTQV